MLDFTIPTSAVAVATRVIIETGTDIDGYRAPQHWFMVTPPGSPPPPPSLSSLTLSSSTVLSGSTVTGTLRLTSPAPAGGAVVRLQGSMEGQVIVPQKRHYSRRQHQRHLYDNARAGKLRFRTGHYFR